jgi:hypothetical protein
MLDPDTADFPKQLVQVTPQLIFMQSPNPSAQLVLGLWKFSASKLIYAIGHIPIGQSLGFSIVVIGVLVCCANAI